MKAELIPLVGITLDSKTIRLGDTRADVEQTLENPSHTCS